MGRKQTVGIKTKGKPTNSTNAVPYGWEDFAQSVASYERSRYGTINPMDVGRPAVDVSCETRKPYDGHRNRPDWGTALLSLLVAMGRDGVPLRDIAPLCEATATVWLEAGAEPHPLYPLAPVQTAPHGGSTAGE